MSRKTTYLACFALLFCLAGSASAQPYEIYYWTTQDALHAPGGGNWEDPNNWITSPGGVTPAGPPNDHTWFLMDMSSYYVDSAGINTGVLNINRGVCATPFRLTIGCNRWPNFDVYRKMDGTNVNNPYGSYDPNVPNLLPPGVLNVYAVGDPCDVGGDPCDVNAMDPNGWGLHCHGECGIGHQYPYGEGILNVYGTARVEGLRVAQAERALGTVNVYDGARLEVGWWGCFLGMDMSYNRQGTAMINLKGTGKMTVWGDAETVPDGMDGIQMFSWLANVDGNDVNLCNSHIDIEGGIIEVFGKHVAQLQSYVDNGWLTSYGGAEPNCDPNVFYIIREWDDVNYPDPNNDPNLVGWTYVQSYGSGCTCKGYLDTDLNQDCYVNVTDFGIFADDWLKCMDAWDARCLQYLPQ